MRSRGGITPSSGDRQTRTRTPEAVPRDNQAQQGSPEVDGDSWTTVRGRNVEGVLNILLLDIFNSNLFNKFIIAICA